jgi:hypothetical protein
MAQGSVIYKPKQLPSRELNQGGTSSSQLIFLDNSSNPLVCYINVPAMASTTGKAASMFRIVAGGRITGGTTSSFTATLNWGTSATTTADTAMHASASVACNSVSGFWGIEATCWIDSTSTKLDGYACDMVSGSTTTFTAIKKLDNTISASSTPALSLTTQTGQGFVVGGTWSSGNAGNIAYLDVFQVEMVG